MFYVINYAEGEPYESLRKVNTKSAYLFGKADKVLEYSSTDIPHSYKEQHKDIFAYKRGAGLWLWKPYIISDALGKINDGDWLLYLDSGITVIRDIHYLINNAKSNNTSIFIMEQPLLNRQFTKRECFIKMGIEDEDNNQVLGLLLLLRKSEESIHFVQEWLHKCEDVELLSPEHFHPEISEWKDYYSHREDQSILSLLRIKYKLPTFRDCSDYGKFPFQYANPKYAYNPKVYDNSNYPTVILCNRKAKPYAYFIKYCLKVIANKVHYYTEEKVLKKRGIIRYIRQQIYADTNFR